MVRDWALASPPKITIKEASRADFVISFIKPQWTPRD